MSELMATEPRPGRMTPLPACARTRVPAAVRRAALPALLLAALALARPGAHAQGPADPGAGLVGVACVAQTPPVAALTPLQGPYDRPLSFKFQLTYPAGNTPSICTVILTAPVTFREVAGEKSPSGWRVTASRRQLLWQASERSCLEGGQTLTLPWSAVCSSKHDNRDKHVITWRAISSSGRHWTGKFDFRAYTESNTPGTLAMDLQAVPAAAVVRPGEPFTYIVTLTNIGDEDIARADVAVVLPPGLTYTGWHGDEEITQTTSAPPAFRLVRLWAGASKVLSLDLRASGNAADLNDPVTLALTATGISVDGVPLTATPITVRSPLHVPGTGLEVFVAAHPGVVVPGQRLSYDITITNTGDEKLFNIDIADETAGGLTLVGAQLPQGVQWLSSPPLTYRVDELAPGASRFFTLDFTASPGVGALSDPVECDFSAAGRDMAGNAILAAPYTTSLPLGSGEVGLALQKTCSQAVIVPGEPVTYQLTVSNTGSEALSAVMVTDAAPPQLTYLHAVHDGAVLPISSNPPAFVIAELAPYATKVIGLSFASDADYTAYPGTLVNTASASAESAGGDAITTDPASAAVPVAPRGASLQVSKVCVDHAHVLLGREATYVITVRNTGDQDLHDVAIHELPDSVLSLAAAQFGPAVEQTADDPPVFRLAHLPVHGEQTLALTFAVGLHTPTDQPVTNAVYARALDQGGEAVVTDTAAVVLPFVRLTSAMRLNKVATTGAVMPGGTITYILSVENRGEMDLFDVVITDLLPDGLTFTLADPGPGLTQTDLAPPTFKLPQMVPGSSATVAITCTAAADPALLGGEILNIARAVARDEADAMVRAGPDSSTVPVLLPERELAVQKAALRDRIVPGEEITYLVTVANTGAQDLTNVTVTDVPPGGLTLAKAEHDDGIVAAPGWPPTFTIPVLGAGEHELISLVFLADDDPAALDSPSVNRVTAQGLAPGEALVIALPDSSTLPVVPAEGSIDVEKTAVESPLPAGGLGHYIITVTNTGPVPLAAVTVHDLLPAGLTYVDAEPAATPSAPGALTWVLADLAPGRSHTIVLSVGVDYALHDQSVTNTAAAAGVTPDTRTVTDVDAAATACRAEDSSIHVDKLANESRLLMGGQVSYHLLLTNDGGLPLDSLVVRDSIPDGLAYVNADFDTEAFDLVSTDPVVILRSDPGRTLAPGAEEAITLFFDAARGYEAYNLAPLDSTVLNLARVTARDPLFAVVSDQDEAALDLTAPRAAIQVHYAHTTGEIVPDELATYLVTVENIGDQALVDVELSSAELDAQGLAYVESNHDPSRVTTAHGGGYHRWLFTGPLAAGAAEEIRVTYRASREILALVPGGVVTSRAAAEGLDLSGQTVGDSADEAVPLSPKRGAVQIDNTAAQGEIMPGETVTYILTVTAGPELDLADLAVTAENLTAIHLTLAQATFDAEVFRQTGTFTWTARDTFPAGAQEEIRVTYRAADSAAELPLHVGMTATVVAHDVYARALEDSDEEVLPVLLPESHLLLEKTTLATAAVPGEPLTFLLTATNNGNQVLDELVLVDELPDPLAPLAWYADSSAVTYDGGDPARPRWTLARSLEPGEAITVRFVAAADPDPTRYGETLTNIATAAAVDEGGGTLEGRAVDVVPVHLPTVAVEVTKTPAQNLIVPGGTVTYNLLVANVGRTDLTAIELVEEIPAGLSFASSFHDNAQATLIDTDPQVVWEIDPLAPGLSTNLQVTFAVTADAGQLNNPLVNTATVAATGPGNQIVTDLDQAGLPVQAAVPSVYIEKRASASVARTGELLDYVITVVNDGNQALTGVAVSDTLAAGLSYRTARFDEGLATLVASEPSIEWTLTGELAPGDRRSLYLTVYVSAVVDSIANPVVNTAYARGWAPGDVPVADEATETLPLQQSGPLVTIQKFTTAPVVWPGRDILYTLQVTNTGTRDIVKAVLRDELPQGLNYVNSVYDAAAVGFAGNAAGPAWSLASLPIGATETVTVRLRAAADILSLDDPVVNVAKVTAWDSEGVPSSDSDFEETPLADLDPALALNALATSGAIVPGSQVTYLVDVTNTGDEALFEVVVTDTLPSGLSIFSTDFDPVHVVEQRAATELRRAPAGDGREVITWTMQVLPVAAIERMRLSCNVTENSAALDSLVANTFRATAVSAGQTSVADSDGDALPVVAAGAAIGLDKTALRGDVVPGEFLTYLITVRNAGATRLAGLRVADAVPAGLSFQQADYDNTVAVLAAAGADSVVWTLAELPVGGYEQLRVTYLAAAGLVGNVAADTLASEARVIARDPGGQPVTAGDGETLPIHPQRAGIQLLKWADATSGLAVRGAEIAYHVQVVNTGEQDLAPVTVIDYMPAGLRYLEADATPDSVVADGAETRVYWSRSVLHQVESWEVLVRARIDTLLVDGAVLQNQATAIGVDERGGEVRSSDVSRVLAGLPDLRVAKTVDRPTARPGARLTYTLSYRNSGTADAEDVVVLDVLPPELTYVTGSATGGAFYEPSARAVTRARDRLEIDQGAIFTYQALLAAGTPAGTRVPNVAEVHAQGLSAAMSDTAWVLVADQAAELVKTVDKSVAVVGDTLTYTLTYHNLSDADLGGVVITDQVPSELDPLYTGASGEGVYDPGLRRMTWTIGGLEAGHVGSVAFRAIVRPDAGLNGQVSNQGLLATGTFSVESNRALTLIVSAAAVTLTKSVDRALAVPGDRLNYFFRLANIGPAPLTGVTVTDPLPAELDYLPPDSELAGGVPAPAYDVAAHALTWTIGVIPPGARLDLACAARVGTNVRSGSMVSNTATVETQEAEPIVSNPANTLVQYPDLAIGKQADRSPVVVGQEITYEVVIRNRADGPTDSTWVVDLLPAGFAYVSGTSLLRSEGVALSGADPFAHEGDAPAGAWGDAGGEAWRWNLGRLGAYEADTLTYRVRVTGEAGPGRHDNHAAACGVTPLGGEVCGDPATAAVEVVVPALTLTKTTPERSVDIGDVVLYRVAVQNNTTAPVADLEIRDHLPLGFRILPGSTTLDGVRASDPVLYADGLPAGAAVGPAGDGPGRDIAVWSLPRLAGGSEIELVYTAVVGLNASSGVAANLAEAVGLDEGGGAVAAGPAEARVFVLEDELPGRLRGRVIIDCNDDGRPDLAQPRGLRLTSAGTLVDEQGDVVTGMEEGERQPWQGLEILIEDGRLVRTDALGEFCFYPLERGDHAVYLDPRGLEPGARLLGHDSEFFTVLEGGEARVEFRICPPPPKRGSVQLVKSVAPAEVMAVRRVLEPEVFLVEGVLFDSGRATLRPEALRVLGEAGQRLIDDPSATARVEGHTDTRPIRTTQFADNQALSEARAAAVRDALVGQFGLAPERFSVRGFGAERPLAPNTTARNQSLNRRTEIVILPSLDSLSTAALFEPSQVEFTLRVAYEGDYPAGEGTLGEAIVRDALPEGLEYLLASTRINGQPGDDPEILLERAVDARSGGGRAADGRAGDGGTGGRPAASDRLLAWRLGALRPGDALEIRYQAVITDAPRAERAQPIARVAMRSAAGETETEAHSVAAVDSLLRDPAYREGRHRWENRAWFTARRAGGDEVRTDPAGADLRLAFERTLAPIRITVEDVLFETGRAVLRPEAFGVLDPAAEIIRSRPGCRVRIEGHTDIRPIRTAEFPSNQELSEARARAVADYFSEVEKLPAEIFSTRGFGPRRPAADNETAPGRQRNRRVEIVIVGEDAAEQSFAPAPPGRHPQSVRIDLH